MNTTGSDLDLSKGQVSAALLNKASQKIQEEIKQRKRRHVSEGEVIPTGGHYLSCKKVYHTVCAPKGYTGNKANEVGFLIYNQLSIL